MRPHTRPELVPAGTNRLHVCPGSSRRPPPTGVAAGYTVKPQLFLMVKVEALAPATEVAARSSRRIEDEEAAIGASSLLLFALEVEEGVCVYL